MKKLLGLFVLVTALFTLNGCAQNSYSSNTGTGSSSSGVTIYGDIDTSIVRTR